MGNLTLPKILLILLVSLSVSCSREETPGEPALPEEEQNPTISIAAARALFSEYQESFTFFPRQTTRAGEDEASEVIDLTRYLDWASAREALLVGYDVVEVPVVGYWITLLDPEDPEPEPNPEDLPEDETPRPAPNLSVKLVAGINSWGEPYYRTLHIYPDDSFAESSGIKANEMTLTDIEVGFSGTLYLFDMDGFFTFGYILEDGILTGLIYRPEEIPKHSIAASATRSDNCYTNILKFLNTRPCT
ncbi:MAG: hypothetical protein LUE10_05795, partial [Alistipes sp.]|nr:hypothetical protein [Alistipes sp.]